MQVNGRVVGFSCFVEAWKTRDAQTVFGVGRVCFWEKGVGRKGVRRWCYCLVNFSARARFPSRRSLNTEGLKRSTS